MVLAFDTAEPRPKRCVLCRWAHHLAEGPARCQQCWVDLSSADAQWAEDDGPDAFAVPVAPDPVDADSRPMGPTRAARANHLLVHQL